LVFIGHIRAVVAHRSNSIAIRVVIGILRVCGPVAVEVGVADVPHAVAVRIPLSRVGNERTVVHEVWNAIPIQIGVLVVLDAIAIQIPVADVTDVISIRIPQTRIRSGLTAATRATCACASIPDPIVVGVPLIRVGHLRAVVAEGWDGILVKVVVRLLLIRNAIAVKIAIARVSDSVFIPIFLQWVGCEGAIVDLISDSITIRIGILIVRDGIAIDVGIAQVANAVPVGVSLARVEYGVAVVSKVLNEVSIEIRILSVWDSISIEISRFRSVRVGISVLEGTPRIAGAKRVCISQKSQRDHGWCSAEEGFTDLALAVPQSEIDSYRRSSESLESVSQEARSQCKHQGQYQ
jgi:hypothetical protein